MSSNTTVSDSEHGHNFYGYTPTESICIIFLVLFSASTLIQIVETIYFKTWFTFYTLVLSGIGEVVGWAGRLWSSSDPTLKNAYLMQTVSTGVAPTLMIAANFVIFGSIIRNLGPEYSRLPPRWYLIFFCTSDLVALSVQGSGGGIAGSATDIDRANFGANIMLGGIAFQMATMTVYAIFAAEFVYRYIKRKPIHARTDRLMLQAGRSNTSDVVTIRSTAGAEKPQAHTRFEDVDKRLKIMSGALIATTVLIYIRCIYRVIELTDGWNGPIITRELWFNVWDGAMIILAAYIFNMLHPGYLIYGNRATEPKARVREDV